MFQESPFSGVCAYATWEVLLMLVGTLLLGLLLGYLIWGWTRRKLLEAESQIISLKETNRNLKLQLTELTTSYHVQRQELDAINVSYVNQRQLMSALTATNSDLKRQLDEITEEDNAKSLEFAKLEGQLIEEKSRTADLKRALDTSPIAKVTEEAKFSVESKHPSMEFEIASLEPDQPSIEHEILAIASEIFNKQVMSNDLTIIEGIGPKIAEVLGNSGITSWEKLSDTTRHILRVILDEAGAKFRGHKPKTWPRQARMAANGEWKKLKAYQDVLLGGK